jgi:hypothetical protein
VASKLTRTQKEQLTAIHGFGQSRQELRRRAFSQTSSITKNRRRPASCRTLRNSSQARRACVKFSGDKRTAIDEPFAETMDLIAGIWLW